METINIDIARSERDLFNTSTPPYENNSYGLESSLLTNNNQGAIQSDRLLFIDSTVEDYQVLTDSLVHETEVVILDSQRDGIVQITESLQQYDDLEAIHIVSHGDVGELSLGNAKLNSNSIYEYDDLLSSWNNYLKEDGDILLYGCNVGASASGREFVESLSQYTTADVSASVDDTGKDGDWELEAKVGKVEATSIFDSDIDSTYQHTLATRLTSSIYLGFDDGFEINDGFNDRFNDNFNDQIDRELFGSRDDDEVDASDYSSFASLPADNLVRLARNGLNFAEVSSDTLATIDFNNIPIEDFQILKNAGLSLAPLSFEALSNVNLGVLKNFDYLSQVDLSQTQFDNLTVFGQLSATFVSNANLYNYKADLDIDSGLNLDKIAQLSLSDFQAIDYAFDGDEIFDSVHYTNLRKTLNGTNPYTDYVQNGWKLGLDPHPLFDTSYYLAQNTDVRDDGAEPLKHYIMTGYSELNPNRDPHPLFDTSYYQDNNTDIVNADKNPLLHYIENGLTENLDSRDPNRFFDSSYYNANNPKVVEAGMNPLVHYLRHGWKESRRDNPGGFNPNRDPSPFFDTSFYLDTNIDVLEASYLLDSANPVQHALEFGINGLYANENRIAHPIFESENQAAYTITITADSPGFEFAQNKFREVDIELTSREGGIEVAGLFLLPAAPLVIKVIELTITAGTLYLLKDRLEDAAEGVIDIYQAVADSDAYQTLSISQDDIITGTPPFLDDPVESSRITSFPGGNTSEDLLDFDGRFYTPLESIEEANNVTTFPQRDEILDSILNEPLVFPGEEVPVGTYAYPTAINSDWSEGFENGENPNIIIDNSPSGSDFTRASNIRDEVATSSFVNRKTRNKFGFINPENGIRTRGNISFADYNINGKIDSIKAYSGGPDSVADRVNDIPGFAEYVAPEARRIPSFVAGTYNRAVDGESKILEQIFVDVVRPGDTGTITLYSENPVCNGCGQTIENFIEEAQKIGADIKVRVVELRR